MASAADRAASARAAESASADAALGPDLVAKREAARGAQAPQAPAQATEDSPEGAVLSVRYFLELYRYAFMTGHTEDLKTMSDEQCQFCRSASEHAEKLHSDGGWADHWEITIGKTSYYEPTDTFPYTRIEATVSTSESSSYGGDGSKRTSPADPDHVLAFGMYHNGTRWIIKGVDPQ